MSETDLLDAFAGVATAQFAVAWSDGDVPMRRVRNVSRRTIMEEREAPPPSQQVEIAVEPVDPSVYSVGPNAVIPEESFDETDDVRQWDGGTSDFTVDDVDSPVRLIEERLPKAELISNEIQE